MSVLPTSSDWSCDHVLHGRLKVWQSRRGYRFSVDALLLAFHAAPGRPQERILDLGTGCGIIPLVTAYRFPQARVYGVEIQTELAALALFNAMENGLQDRITILKGDYRQLPATALGRPLDMVITNPPYRRSGSGRINPQPQRALARHEITTSLDGLVKAMRRFLKTGGRGWMIYSSERLVELLAALSAHHLEPKYLRFIHSHRDAPARQCLIKIVKGASPGMQTAPPLVVYRGEGRYSNEVAAMLGP